MEARNLTNLKAELLFLATEYDNHVEMASISIHGTRDSHNGVYKCENFAQHVEDGDFFQTARINFPFHRSIDLEEDVDPPIPSPDFMNEIRKEELIEAEGKREKKEEKKEEKKIEKKEKEEKKEDHKEHKKDMKKDWSKEDLQTKTVVEDKTETQRHTKPKARSWSGME
ncbi:hypothetical protein CAEBREN_30290, partial [Caenorhabditis brenneri]